MRGYVADRWEDGALVCCADGESGRDCSEKLSFPCPRVSRPEGRRVLLFEALGSSLPYVRVAGAIALPDGKAALIMMPDESRLAAMRSRFDEIFKKRT